MKIEIRHLKKLGFKYSEYTHTSGWDDLWIKNGLELYGNPFKKGWTIESESPHRQIYSVKALKRILKKMSLSACRSRE
jgi:hypothetical protein